MIEERMILQRICCHIDAHICLIVRDRSLKNNISIQLVVIVSITIINKTHSIIHVQSNIFLPGGKEKQMA